MPSWVTRCARQLDELDANDRRCAESGQKTRALRENLTARPAFSYGACAAGVDAAPAVPAAGALVFVFVFVFAPLAAGALASDPLAASAAGASPPAVCSLASLAVF